MESHAKVMEIVGYTREGSLLKCLQVFIDYLWSVVKPVLKMKTIWNARQKKQYTPFVEHANTYTL